MSHQQKVIVDEVSGWLRVFDDGSVDRTWLGPPQFKFMVDPVPSHEEFIDGVATRDVAIVERSKLGTTHRVRIYLPATPDHEKGSSHSSGSGVGKEQITTKCKLPVLIHFQGGGFCISQADWHMYYTVYANLARSTPAIVVSVYLPLAPEHRLPAAVDAGHATLLWLCFSARVTSTSDQQQYSWLSTHADFNRVFLIGDSSGGNIVHEVAARAGNSDLSPLKLSGAIPVHPGFVRAERSRSELEHPQSPFLTLDMADKFISLALPIGSTKDHPIICPMGQEAPPLEELNLPPMLLCVAEKDLMWDTEMEYYEAMKKAGKDVELFVSRGMTHSFYLNKIAVEMEPATKAEAERLFEKIVEFIKRH